MTVLDEARQYLSKMREHSDCCGVPIVRKLVTELERLDDKEDRRWVCGGCRVLMTYEESQNHQCAVAR